MVKRTLYVILASASLGFIADLAVASTHEFYRNKIVRIIVGFSPGGGFDVYSRTIARHMGKHIPGNPTVVVENMTGAGSLIAANHVYKVAKPDGLTIGNFLGGLILQQVLGKPGIEFDARNFGYIGAPQKNTELCGFTKTSGITSVAKWIASKTPVKLGGVAPGSPTDDIPKILEPALGLPIKLVTGYKGLSEIRLAVEGGEVDGFCGLSWDGIKAGWARAIEAGDVVIVLQFRVQPHPELPRVPLGINFTKSEEARQLMEAGIHDVSIYTRPYVLPPGTPKERVLILRKAFADTMNDPELLADANKSKLGIDPLTGDELERIVMRLFNLSPTLVVRLRDILLK